VTPSLALPAASRVPGGLTTSARPRVRLRRQCSQTVIILVADTALSAWLREWFGAVDSAILNKRARQWRFR